MKIWRKRKTRRERNKENPTQARRAILNRVGKGKNLIKKESIHFLESTRVTQKVLAGQTFGNRRKTDVGTLLL